MPTNVKTTDMVFPYSLGLIRPGGAYLTASLPLTTNIQPIDAQNKPDYRFNGIWIQASPDNDASILICNSAAVPDTVNYTNVIGWLQPGEWYPREKQWGNNRDIRGIFVGALNATDFAIALIDQI